MVKRTDHLDHITNAQIQFNLAKCLICYHAILFWKSSRAILATNQHFTLLDSHTHSQKTTQHDVQKYARTQKRPIIRKKCTCASLEVTNTGPNIQIFQPLCFVLRKLPKKRACFVYVNRVMYPRQEVHERNSNSKHTYRHSHIISQQGKMHRHKHFTDKSVTCESLPAILVASF